MPKINQEEYEVLKELDDEWKWIARDDSNSMYVYKLKPYKNKSRWWWMGVSSVDLFNRLGFEFIQWEDEEPYNIAELIEEYEYSAEHVSHVVNERVKVLGKAWSESEEAEVKTLESIREEIWEEMLRLEDKRKDQWADIKYQTLREVLQKLGHLDEPEKALEQEAVDELIKKYSKDEMSTYDVKVERERFVKDLQNLLVPKQELPVIPKFVAEVIEEHKELGYDVYDSIDLIIKTNGEGLPSISNWVAGNIDKYARAWLDGFTVEEEQKYYVLDKKGHLLIRGFSDGTVGRVGDRMKPDLYPDWNKKNLPLTEQEIKDYDERYWPFAVKSSL